MVAGRGLRARGKALEMSLRAGVPVPLRRLYRLARSLRHAEASRLLPPSLFVDCRMVASREELIARLPAHGLVAEVGTYRGDFARTILARAAPVRLHVVDIDFSQFDSGLDDPRLSRHQGLSHQVMAGFPDQLFDWIYIDADHSFEGCLRDAMTCAAKVKPGGYLVFNDFAHIDPWLGRYGVHRAVTTFASEQHWPFAFLSYDASGLYDVALRKPG